MNTPLSASLITRHLTRCRGAELIVVETVHSTNTLAKELITGGKLPETQTGPPGLRMVIIADSQTAGRGRRQNRWVSPAGKGIYLSIILRTGIEHREMPLLNISVGVACAEAVRKATTLPALLKWPNDLYLDNKKMGGILLECGSGNRPYSIAGIGINLNTEPADFSAEVGAIATSASICSGMTYDRHTMIASLIESVAGWVESTEQDPEKTVKRWKELSWSLGREVTVRAGKRTIHGIARDIDPSGFLLLEREDGHMERIVTV